MSTVIGLRSHHITWTELKCPKGQSHHDMANYMRLLPDGNIEVETLYRYGKPKTKVYTPEEFDQWQERVDKLKMGETNGYI